ncbi:MAG: hypothetical protein M3024_09850, partial [Candidatus Dormibacteraeota bacterium]|nr:hypothetical protein [Candidatus Dormibacteraeota bacterium]
RPAEAVPAALAVERRHPSRATQQRGACLRGLLVPDPTARTFLLARYRRLPEGEAYRLDAARVTHWQGFEVRTAPLAARSRLAAWN